RSNLVLHLHGLDHHQAPPRFHFFSLSHEYPHHFPGHRRHDLLASLDFHGSAAASLPLARVHHARIEARPAHHHGQSRGRTFHPHLKRRAILQNGIDSRTDFHRIRFHRPAIEGAAEPPSLARNL